MGRPTVNKQRTHNHGNRQQRKIFGLPLGEDWLIALAYLLNTASTACMTGSLKFFSS